MIWVKSEVLQPHTFSMYFIKLIIIFRVLTLMFILQIIKQKVSLWAPWPPRLFCHQNRAMPPTQDSLFQQPLIKSLWTSIHKVCVTDKQKQAAENPFAKGWYLSVMLTYMTILHRVSVIFYPLLICKGI